MRKDRVEFDRPEFSVVADESDTAVTFSFDDYIKKHLFVFGFELPSAM